MLASVAAGCDGPEEMVCWKKIRRIHNENQEGTGGGNCHDRPNAQIFRELRLPGSQEKFIVADGKQSIAIALKHTVFHLYLR